VYYAACKLYKQFVDSTQKAPINLKRGKFFEIEQLILQVIEDITFAHKLDGDMSARLSWIAEALKKMNRIRISVRMIHDLKYITDKGFSAIMNKEDKVVRQLNGWRRSTGRNAE